MSQIPYYFNININNFNSGQEKNLVWLPGASKLASVALQVFLKVTADCNLSGKKGKHGEVLVCLLMLFLQ